jgi:hypothetical protein
MHETIVGEKLIMLFIAVFTAFVKVCRVFGLAAGAATKERLGGYL